MIKIIPIAIKPRIPLYKESIKTKVDPIFLSKSKDIDSTLHKWKKVLYYKFSNPGCYIYGI